MDQPITRAEHEEFRRRLEEENSRQDRRIALLEESVSKMGALSTSVEKLALSMESMVKEQEKQGKRLETLEDRDGEMWRKAVGYVVTAVIGVFSRICVHATRFLGGVLDEHYFVSERGQNCADQRFCAVGISVSVWMR